MPDDGKPTRIRWQPKRGVRMGFTGRAGSRSPELFRVYGPNPRSDQHLLTSRLLGMESRTSYGPEDEVKAEAERWLEEFASSLGAVFPETETEEPFGVIAYRVRRDGKPYVGGTSLRETADKSAVACEVCRHLPADGLHGWTSDWITLCGAARDHALETGHTVAVEAWHGAIYGPDGTALTGTETT